MMVLLAVPVSCGFEEITRTLYPDDGVRLGIVAEIDPDTVALMEPMLIAFEKLPVLSES